jgi:hypothetical protein
LQFTELQKALFSALNGQLSAPVVEDVEQGSTFPCVTIGENQHNDFSTDTEDGAEVLITIHTWSRTDSIKETLVLLDEINAILNRSELVLTSWLCAGVSFDMSSVMKDPDGRTRHGVIRFTAIIGDI